MNRPFRRCFMLILPLLAGLAACGGTDAYVYKAKEFDRNDKEFNKQPTDRDGVTICYNGAGTTDKQVAEMAQQECGRFGKVARPIEETFGECPLLTPVQARFACLKAEASGRE
jgi:hypothetical protein